MEQLTLCIYIDFFNFISATSYAFTYRVNLTHISTRDVSSALESIPQRKFVLRDDT